jgi:hypothetical protein
MLGALRMTIQDTMKELHTLGSKLQMEEEGGLVSSKDRLAILKGEMEEMLGRQHIPMDIELQDERFSSLRCKVQVFSPITFVSP